MIHERKQRVEFTYQDLPIVADVREMYSQFVKRYHYQISIQVGPYPFDVRMHQWNSDDKDTFYVSSTVAMLPEPGQKQFRGDGTIQSAEYLSAEKCFARVVRYLVKRVKKIQAVQQ